MHEQWKLFLDKGKQNLDISRTLFKDEFYGQTAYHVQQAIELAIKAYALKFELLEIPKSNNLFKTHLPSKILLKEIYAKMIEDFNHIKTQDLDPLIEENMHESIMLLQKTSKIMKDADKNPRALEELWKFSLGIYVTGSKIESFVDEIQKIADTKVPFEFVESMIMYMRTKFTDLFDEVKRSRKSHLIPSMMKEFRKRCEEKGIPPESFDLYFQDTRGEKLAKQVHDSIEATKTIDLLELCYGKNGFIEDIKKFAPNLKKFSDINYEKMMRLIYLSSLNKAVLLSYPHEEYGRYSEVIDEKSTEDIYIEHVKDLQIIIAECEKGFQQLSKFLEKPKEQEKLAFTSN